MLGNVMLLGILIFTVFGIVGVQLWAGLLRNRCFHSGFPNPSSLMLDNKNRSILETAMAAGAAAVGTSSNNASSGFDIDYMDFADMYYEPESGDDFVCSTGSGMTTCNDVPPQFAQYNYTVCRPCNRNPFKGSISFDNIGYAFIAIFQVIQLEITQF